MESKISNVAIIGAGAAGMTTAYQLAKAGIAVEVFEAGPAVGGLARSLEMWGQTVDLGPHRFFSSDTRVNELWLEAVDGDYVIVDRLTRILYQGKFYAYPLRPFNALLNLGPVEAARCMLSYCFAKLRPVERDGTFESWLVSRFGQRLFEIFFRGYSEKLWGIPCSEIDSDFAAQRIRKFSLFEAVVSAVLGGGGQRHKTLVDQFAYPRRGTGVVYDRMAEAVIERGGRLHLSTPIERVLIEGNRATGLVLANGERRSFDTVVSTMPISLLVRGLENVPQPVLEAVTRLRFRNTILVYLDMDCGDLFPDNWIYVQSEEFRMGRITNFRNWSPEMYGTQVSSILAIEYWCNTGDSLWEAPDDEIVALATRELGASGMSEGAEVLHSHVHRLPRCYPIYNVGYRDALIPVQDYLRSIKGLMAIGRYGSFKYNNQDHSILMGILAAENIVSGASHDLWEINTDYENYQEHSVITATGLERLD